MVECVEVFEGLSVLLSGMLFGGNIGGLINIVLKWVGDWFVN